VIAVALGTALAAGVVRKLRPFVLVGVPLVVSIVLINTFAYPGAVDFITEVGPLRPTWTGLSEALQAVLRVAGLLLAVGVFARTTDPDDLLGDLERRGIGRRGVFVMGAALSAIPRLTTRGSEIVDSQRARALDTDGPFWRRARGVVPLAGPLIMAALNEAEEQTLALEARAFSAPGRRTELVPHTEAAFERPTRWLLVLAGSGLVIGSITGLVRLP
jgi:energy-coupling factor transport system permease protein